MRQDQQPANPDDRANSPFWKSRKWLLHIVYRIVSRYGIIKYCKDGNDKAFGEIFAVRQ